MHHSILSSRPLWVPIRWGDRISKEEGHTSGHRCYPKARMQHPDQCRNFNRALSTPGVVALREIGLDFAGPSPSTQEVREIKQMK